MTYNVVKAINVDTLWLKQETTYFKLITSEINDLMMNNFQLLGTLLFKSNQINNCTLVSNQTTSN